MVKQYVGILILVLLAWPAAGAEEAKEIASKTAPIIPQLEKDKTKTFWLMVGVQVGTGIADAEMTRYRIRQAERHPYDFACKELNPFLSKNPSRVRMYLEGAAVLVVTNYIARRLDRAGHHRWARIVQIVPIAGFTFGLQHNIRRGPPPIR